MKQRAKLFKFLLGIFLASVVFLALELPLIGFPGTCGFTGKYGDTLVTNEFVAWLVFGLLLLAVLGAFLSVVLAVCAAIAGALPRT